MIAVKKSGSACENEMARTTKVVPTKRTRADTSALLLPGGDEQKVEAPLKPEDDLDKYDRDRDAPDKASRAVVQAMDKVFFSARYYIKPRSSEEHEHLVHYVKLRRLELLVNYGNYLGQELQVIRKAAAIGADSEIRKAALDLGPPKTWLTIADELAGTDMNDLRKNV